MDNKQGKKDPSRVIKEVESRRRKREQAQQRNMLLAALAALIVLVLVIVLIVNSCSGKDDNTNPQETQPVTTAVPEPTPVPTPGPTAQPEVYLPVIEHGPTESKRIAVTVDDLNEVDNLNQIISIAESSKAKLTLFAIGKTVTEKSDLQVALRRAHNLGYELENHTYSHSRLFSLTDEEMASEIYMTQMAVNKALGVEYEMHFLRMPGGNGEHDLRTHQYLVQLGNYKGIANWTYSGSNASIKNIEKNLKNGSIFLFHCKAEDLKKLKEFIPYAVSQGYELVTLNELLGYEDNNVTALKGEAMDYEIPAPLPFVYENYVTLGNKDYKQLYAVQLLQKRLIELGYLSSTAKVDGDYGNDTKLAVQLFQAAAGLKVDGFAGAETQNYLFSDVAPYNAGNVVAGEATAAPVTEAPSGVDQPFGGS
ncbi:MAG: polysaccharide deacetylase family protein [Clostridia bacterium]|nr:polysaccharide deacetylase family protein [Clostridia bacterium]MBR5750870.1 polysaccharide deacetylase family protein [Clostridia bacterium]